MIAGTKKNEILLQLSEGGIKSDKDKGKIHQVFERFIPSRVSTSSREQSRTWRHI